MAAPLTLPTTYNWFIALLGSGIEDGAARLPVFPRDGIRSARQASALAEQSRADDSTLRTSEQEVMRLDFFG